MEVEDGTRTGDRRRFDTAGAATITGAVLALVHTAPTVAAEGVSTVVVGGAATAVALLALFVAVERRASNPLVPLEALASRAASFGVVLALLGDAARASTFVLVALYLQQGLC